jgi:Pyridine nucleotide-disulphide oxidoreductase, dimerisation domain
MCAYLLAFSPLRRLFPCNHRTPPCTTLLYSTLLYSIPCNSTELHSQPTPPMHPHPTRSFATQLHSAPSSSTLIHFAPSVTTHTPPHSTPQVATYDLEFTNRALVYGHKRRQGFVKLVVTNDEHMRVLGMRAAGLEASSLIETMGLFIVEGRSIRELTKLIHPHPAICEAIQECVRLLLGVSLYKPEYFDNKFFSTASWSPPTLPAAAVDGASGGEASDPTPTPQVVPVPTYT